MVPDDGQHLVVGVGASASGSAGLEEFIASLPAGRAAAYVLVQSSGRDNSVAVVAGLSGGGLRVMVAEADAVLESGTVYVGGSDSLIVRDGRFVTEAWPLEEEGAHPFDHLFHSLAKEYGARSVGVVLSGGGPDGVSGLRDIRDAGGLTIAGDPQASRESALPLRAIDAGVVDLVLTIAEMPAALDRFASQPGSGREGSGSRRVVPPDRNPSKPSLQEFGKAETARLSILLAPQLEFDLRVYKQGPVERRVVRRMVLAGYHDVRVYLDHVAADARERRALARDLLIGVTDFFRDKEAFRALRRDAIDPLVERSENRAVLRVWVPGCSTGEEAYSIGMEFLDSIKRSDRPLTVQVFATDVNHDALAVGRKGDYPDAIAERVPKAYLERYFARHPGRYRVGAELRSVVSFSAHDLTHDPPFSRMDLISCRNVLIYLRPGVQKHVLHVMHYALRAHGNLFLSPSESTGQYRGMFTPLSKPWRVYRKTGTSRPIAVRRSRRNSAAGGTPAHNVVVERTASMSNIPNDQARRSVLMARVPPTIVVAEDGSVLFMHGELRPYLRFPEGESPRFDLSSLVTPDLATRTRSVLYQCRRDHQTVSVLSSPDPSRRGRVRITASPAPDLGDETVILSFEEVTGAETPDAGTPQPVEDAAVQELERELDATRGDLRNTVEELETVNERLRSSHEESLSMNEELQSANEELEATSEELRSLNEELTTVNTQLREKVAQLERAHDDLTNFFSSAKVATVFLDERLKIKRVTPSAAELLGLGASDLGRFVGDVARDLLRNGLEQEARSVLEHLAMQSRELRAGERWVTRQVLPYRTEARRIEGVVVTFMDVTPLKSATERLAMRERQQAVIARAGLFALRSTNLQAFMDQVVREVQQTLQTDFCKILELQPGGQRLLLRSGVGWKEGIIGSGFVPTGADSQAGFTLQSVEPIIVDDLTTERRFSGPSLLLEHGVISGLSCVIREGDNVYGVLGAHTDRRREFTQEDANFLQAVATVIGSAVSRYRTRHRIAIERGVSQALAESQTPDEAFTRVLECFAREFPASTGEIWWPSGDRRRLVRGLFYVHPPSAKERFNEAFGECEFETGQQLVGRVFESGRAVWCTDVADPDVFMRREVQSGLGLVAGFGFPIRAGRNIVGVVAIFSHERLSADESLLALLETLGRAMGDFLTRVKVENRAKRLAAITAAAQDAILTYDSNGTVTEWLEGAESLFGFTADEMIGSTIDRIVPEDRRDELKAINARIRKGEIVDAFETVRRRKDGTLIDVSVRSSPLRDEKGRFSGIASTDRDISPQKDAERRLRQADRQKDEFLAMLGHELRNPLATIRSAAELLKLSPDDPPRLQRTQAVLERQSAHMAKLLDGLLDVSRIIRGTIQLEMARVDFAAICRNVCADVRERIPERDLDIQESVPEAPVWVRGDVVRLTQIIDNLLSNAVKYTPDRGSITMRLSAQADTAVLSIVDTGVGIAPDLLPDIFQVFRQAQQNLDRARGGLGLGLALVKSLVELHGGTVEAHSEGQARGAQFVVRLPIVEGRPSMIESAATTETGPLNVLLIEDNEESAELLREVLELSGHTVWVASRGREGADMAVERTPDLVLCDLGLPHGMTGFDVARELRSHSATRGLRIVALSGYGRPEDKARCIDAGFDAHITKPVDVTTIGRVVAELATRPVSRA